MYNHRTYLGKEPACKRIDFAAVGHFRARAVGRETAERVDLVSSVFVFLIVVYLIAALVQALLPFSVNRLIGAAIVAVLGYDFVTNLTRGRIIASCLICILALAHVGIFSTDQIEEMEFYIYWVAALLTLIYIGSSDHVRSLQQVVLRNRTVLRLILIGIAVFTGALLASGVGYAASWGDSLYFVGFCNEEHTVASVCCLVMGLALLCMKADGLRAPLAFVIIGVMTWALLETGARTFLVPAAVIWVVFVRNSIKWRWLRVSLYCFLGIAAIYVFMRSGMSTKFDYLSTIGTDNSLLNTITSGRIGYWETDLGAYFSNGPIVWLFGNSAASVYDLNYATFNMRIWAHNDFVMLLCSAGLIGAILYILALRIFFTGLAGRADKVSVALIALFVLFPALINGFYSYQHLLYASVILFCAVTWTQESL